MHAHALSGKSVWKSNSYKNFHRSKQMFDVVTMSSSTSEIILMINIAAAREAFEKMLINKVGLISGNLNIADALTKVASNSSLDSTFTTEHDSTQIVQFFTRDESART